MSIESVKPGPHEASISDNVKRDMSKGQKQHVAESKADESRAGGRVGVKKPGRNVGVPRGGA
jgi:hypothetical protein